jgi:chromosome segregation ATPase
MKLSDLIFKKKDSFKKNDLKEIKKQIEEHEDRLNTYDEYIQESENFSIEERKRRVQGSVRHLERLKDEQHQKVTAAERELERKKEELAKREALARSNAMSFKKNSLKKPGLFSRRTTDSYEKEPVKESANSKGKEGLKGLVGRTMAKFI